MFYTLDVFSASKHSTEIGPGLKRPVTPRYSTATHCFCKRGNRASHTTRNVYVQNDEKMIKKQHCKTTATSNKNFTTYANYLFLLRKTLVKPKARGIVHTATRMAQKSALKFIRGSFLPRFTQERPADELENKIKIHRPRTNSTQ